MNRPPGVGSTPQSAVSYSPGLRRAFNLAALGVALLPIPILLLHVLPAYRFHTRFLVFFAPLVCLLTLAYLLYLRDALARMMFRHLIDPLPRAPDYYHERGGIRLRRLWMRARNAFLLVLPAILLLGSLACLMRYTERLNDSLAVSSAALVDRLAATEDVGLVPGAGVQEDGPEANRKGELARDGRRAKSRPPRIDTAAVDTATPVIEGAALRRQALEVATMSEIPYFAELTVLYIGSFLALLVALVLMGLREYAKEALGLSERDVVLGRILIEPE
jgi:hypothetical protein